MENMIASTDPALCKDDLIVIAGAGGFIGGFSGALFPQTRIYTHPRSG
jgi:hypothetical protein